jgi:SAM-dependent methyltransferase
MSSIARSFCTSAPYRIVARRLVLPWALQGLKPRGEVLEIGAGSGAMSAELLSRYPAVKVVVTDYDPEMVEAARRALSAWNGRAVVQEADATDLPFPDGQFSLVLSCAMLHHVVDWEKALAEAVRVLQPGGHLAGFDLLDSPLMRLLHRASGHRGSSQGEPGATRFLRPGQLEAELSRLPVESVRARPAAGSLALRFIATKAG